MSSVDAQQGTPRLPGQALLPDGAADCSALALLFANDPDTGLVRTAANTLGFCTGGALRATVSAGTVASPSIIVGGSGDHGFFIPAGNGLTLAGGAVGRLTLNTSDAQLVTHSSSKYCWSGGAHSYSTAGDTCLSRNAQSVVEINNGTAGTFNDLITRTAISAGVNGQRASLDRFEELHTLAAAATSDTTATIAANSRTRGAVFRITTTITGCATVDAGIAGATSRFGTFSALTATTTLVSTDNSAYASATAIRFTCVGGGGSFTAGVIRATPFYDVLTAPTS